jgi:hypothetical protein
MTIINARKAGPTMPEALRRPATAYYNSGHAQQHQQPVRQRQRPVSRS